VLAVWDTTMIADGDYRLRVMVTLNDGSPVETIVSNLRVRNYTPLETSLPMTSNMENIPTLTPEGLFANMVKPTPTELSPNPARVTVKELRRSVILGLSVSFGLAIIFLVYTFLQKYRR